MKQKVTHIINDTYEQRYLLEIFL